MKTLIQRAVVACLMLPGMVLEYLGHSPTGTKAPR